LEYEKAINNQYGQSDLGIKILAVLQSEGIDTIQLIKEALAPIEELHLRGRSSTIELAQEVELNEKMKVLDIGCGIGGPARTIVSEFGCNVTGIDICDEFCRAADLINERLGYTDKIEIRQGNALDMPFNSNSFDIIFIQHVSMNIKNKKRLFSEIHRLLHPKGRLALNTICAGSDKPIYFPVFWANNPSISFLSLPYDLLQLIEDNGFKELSWTDNTKKIIKTIENWRPKDRSPKPRPISLGSIHVNFTEKRRNGTRNLKEGRTVLIQAVFERV